MFSQDTNHYLNQNEWTSFLKFIENKKTPFLAIDLTDVKKKFLLLRSKVPQAKIFYAIKSNPIPEILSLLKDLGCYFDIASIYELDILLSLNITSDKISYGNTIKKPSDIKYAYDKGVRIFACDSVEDINNIAMFAPESKVFFRLVTDGRGSDWPLSKKFGCHPNELEEIILSAKNKKIIPYGISFHVGSQQRDIGQWDTAIKQCCYLFERLADKGVILQMINIGGGLPCDYLYKTNPLEKYLEEIVGYLEKDFSNTGVDIFIEPGRALVGNSGVIVSEVINKTKKAPTDLNSWLYLDIGIFNGLIETLGEAIKYPITTLKKGKLEEMIIAGPTCDSMDILYKEHKYFLPQTLSSGDKVFFFTAGAYTLTYSSVAFNGFPPLKYYIWNQ